MNSMQCKQELKDFRENFPATIQKTSQGDITVYSMGEGEDTVLLLPGGMFDGEYFFLYMKELAACSRVISVGYPHVKHVSGYVQGIFELLEALNISKIKILGHSFGGIVAQAFVRQYPSMVTGMILNHTTAIDNHIPEKNLKNKIVNYRKTHRSISMLPSFMIKRMNVEKAKRISTQAPEEEKTFWQGFLDEKSKSRNKQDSLCMIQGFIDFYENYCYTPDDLEHWTGDILIIESETDYSFPEEEKDSLKRLYPEAEKIVLEDGAHWALLFNRSYYSGIYKQFFFSGLGKRSPILKP